MSGCMWCVLAVPVVLCLKELELILDAVTRVRGGELEGLTGLRGRLRHKGKNCQLSKQTETTFFLTVKIMGETVQENSSLPCWEFWSKAKQHLRHHFPINQAEKKKAGHHLQILWCSCLCPAAGNRVAFIRRAHLWVCLETLDGPRRLTLFRARLRNEGQLPGNRACMFDFADESMCDICLRRTEPAPQLLAIEDLCLQKARLMCCPMPTICQRNLEEALEVWMCIDYT